MILGLQDLPGGTLVVSFFIWLGLTFLFYLVCYVAALNVVDDLTRNSWLKIPAMWGLSLGSAGLMSILHYKPLVLFAIMAAANYSRVNQMAAPANEKFKALKINKPLFYIASYGYICLMTGLAYYFQSNPMV